MLAEMMIVIESLTAGPVGVDLALLVHVSEVALVLLLVGLTMAVEMSCLSQ